MKKYLPYLITLVTFIVVSLTFFHPVLQGKKIKQSDIVQHKGSSREINEYRVKNNEEPYWTNTSFSGMPAYVVSSYYPNDYIRKFDKLLRFLPRPADYLFLYFVGFFILLSVLKVDWKLALIGSLAFGFSTYYIIILGVGHNAKAHAIAYFPMVLAGIILVFKKRYLIGFIVTALAMALEVNAGHPQMTYYLMLSVIILGLLNLFEAFKTKTLNHFFKSIGVLIVAVILGIGVNATSLMATKHYADQSTRSKSELSFNSNGKSKEQSTGLDKRTINQWSYGFTETFNLFIPRFYGGGSQEQLGENSNAFKLVKKNYGENTAKDFFESGVPTYWGKQPGVAAPAYIGAVIIFLFVLGIFMVKNKLKIWLVATAILSILLSFGSNLSWFTNLFVDYLPLYNKFRAITSIQVLTEMAIPLLGILALKDFFSDKYSKTEKLNYVKYSLYIVGGIALFFTLFGTSFFGFEGVRDREFDKALVGLSDAIIADRKSIFFKDSLRSLILAILTAGILFYYLKQKLKYNYAILVLGIFILFDLVQVNIRYVNENNFTEAREVEKPFVKSKIDKAILKDKGFYRVANFSGSLMNEARTSYFHNSIGGYHAAQPRRYSELFDFQAENIETLNMLNTKYFIFSGEKGLDFQLNEDANGNAWFVNNLISVNSANEEIKGLDSLNTKRTAIIRNDDFKTRNYKQNYAKDSTAIIKLIKMETVKFSYNSFSSSDQFAVFSEMFFKGWKATIDGKETPITRVNYVLRGLEIPKGKHEIIFEYHTDIVKKGNLFVLISYVLLFLIPLIWWFMERKKTV